MIIDLDAHQGNGHETDFSNESKDVVLSLFMNLLLVSNYFLFADRYGLYLGHVQPRNLSICKWLFLKPS